MADQILEVCFNVDIYLIVLPFDGEFAAVVQS